MSLRPVASVVPPASKRSSSSRLKSVLRAGQTTALVTKVYDHAEEDTDSGLTKALKNASLVPTGVCLPRGFDPDYCAYDRYYAIGVALVSAVLGALAETTLPHKLFFTLMSKMQDVLSAQCYTPSEERGNRKWSELKVYEIHAATETFSNTCTVLNDALTRIQSPSESIVQRVELDGPFDVERKGMEAEFVQSLGWINWLRYQADLKDDLVDYKRQEMQDRLRKLQAERNEDMEYRLQTLIHNLLTMIMLPGELLNDTIMVSLRIIDPDNNSLARDLSWLWEWGHRGAKKVIFYNLPDKYHNPDDYDWSPGPFGLFDKGGPHNFLYIAAMAKWTLKHVSRYMNEHALMIASFFRTNARRLSAGQEPMLDLVAFARQCREDIVDGANPPPPPPPAYEDFNPAAVEAERRREDARKRAEERDLLMPGVDYPPPIDASAAGKGGA
jgi:hypothetical protein